jgi:hypothetical protein
MATGQGGILSVLLLFARTLQKVRGQIRSRLVLSPLSDAIKKKKKKIP